MDFCLKGMSLLFSILSRFVIAFLPRSNHLTSWLQLPSTVILESKKRKFVTAFTCPPSICHEVMGLDAMILVLLIFSFKLAFSVSSYTLIKRLLSSSSLSATRKVSSTYLRLLIFLQSINVFDNLCIIQCSILKKWLLRWQHQKPHRFILHWKKSLVKINTF